MIFVGGRAVIGLFFAATVTAEPLCAQAQTKGHSDRSVQVLMDYTWSTIPNQFRHPNGELIVIDKTKKDQVMVPLEKAKEVVGVADRSARAQYCGMVEDQNSNFQTMMRRERASELWSKQQIVFITLLHATTVAYMTGNLKFKFGEDGQKDVEVVSKGAVWTEPCTDPIREKIRERIKDYVENAPKVAPPGKRAEPTPSTAKK